MEPDLVAAITRALDDSRDDLLETCRKWSSGGTSLAQLRREGHPYARRHGRPLRDPGLINIQSGRFLAAWEVHAPVEAGGTVTLAATNEAPEAVFMAGTRVMFERPIGERVLADLLPRIEARIEKMVEAELNRG